LPAIAFLSKKRHDVVGTHGLCQLIVGSGGILAQQLPAIPDNPFARVAGRDIVNAEDS
jgi:hypothetical protein